MTQQEFNLQELYKTSLSNALLHRFLTMVELGEISFEDAMVAAVLALIEANHKLSKELVDQYLHKSV